MLTDKIQSDLNNLESLIGPLFSRESFDQYKIQVMTGLNKRKIEDDDYSPKKRIQSSVEDEMMVMTDFNKQKIEDYSPKKRIQYSVEDKMRVIQTFDELTYFGQTSNLQQYIAKLFNVNQSTISRWIRQRQEIELAYNIESDRIRITTPFQKGKQINDIKTTPQLRLILEVKRLNESDL